MMMKRILALLLAVLMAGCTTYGMGVSDNATEIPAGRGVVVYSTGAAETNLAFSVKLTLVEGATLNKYDKVLTFIDYPFKSHFANEHGHVRSLTLPAGTYYFVPAPGNPAFHTVKAPIFAFTVHPGVVTYIGRVWFALGEFYLDGDHRARDMDYYYNHNLAMKSVASTTDMMRIDRYVYPGSPDSFTIKGINWGAP